MKLIEQVQTAEKCEFLDKRGKRRRLRITKPWSSAEISAFEKCLPCPLPPEVRELLEYCSGFETDFVDRVFNEHTNRIFFDYIGLGEVSPHCVQIAHDHCGNLWIVDVTSSGFGPIFYCSHDPPVFAYQSDSLSRFFEEVFKLGNEPWTSDVLDVWNELSCKIWDENPKVLSWDECLKNSDPDIRSFAESLDSSFLFIDLRNPSLGDGFSIGRFGADTVCKRHGEKRIFAIQKKELTWLQKVFGV